MTKLKIIVAIFGEKFDISDISTITKLVPTDFWEKGDEILGRRKRLVRQETCWELDYGFVDNLFLDEVSEKVVSDFSNSLDVLRNYIFEKGLESKIYIISEIINNETPALYFTKSFLNMISNLNGEIDVDLYVI